MSRFPVRRGSSSSSLGRSDAAREIPAGTMVSRALATAILLASHGIAARVLNAASVQPIDEEAVLAAARETRGIITIRRARALAPAACASAPSTRTS